MSPSLGQERKRKKKRAQTNQHTGGAKTPVDRHERDRRLPSPSDAPARTLPTSSSSPAGRSSTRSAPHAGRHARAPCRVPHPIDPRRAARPPFPAILLEPPQLSRAYSPQPEIPPPPRSRAAMVS